MHDTPFARRVWTCSSRGHWPAHSGSSLRRLQSRQGLFLRWPISKSKISLIIYISGDSPLIAIYPAAAVFLQEGKPAVGISFFAPDRNRSMSLQKTIPTLGFLGSQKSCFLQSVSQGILLSWPAPLIKRKNLFNIQPAPTRPGIIV